MTDKADLTLSAEQMRALGHGVIDMIVDHMSSLADKPVADPGAKAAVSAKIAGALPEQAGDPLEILAHVGADVLGHALHVDHPRFFGYIPGPGNFVGVMADALAAGFNIFAGVEPGNHGPTEVELVTIEWLRRITGMPKGAGGLFTSGGSGANLTGLCVARHRMLGDDFGDAVVYCSDQTHSSIERACRIMGFHPSQLVALPSGSAFRLDPAGLHARVKADRAAGKRPFCVVASAGTTNTGAIDPLDAVADICEAEGLWLHVDGAYGAAAAMVPECAQKLAGLGRAHSLSLDPHKWLFQPIECGCLLVRERPWLRAAFAIVPDYMKDTDLNATAINFRDMGLQTSRALKALKLWMTLKVFGAEAFRDAIRHGLGLAEQAEQYLRRHPHWRIVAPASLGMVVFRYTDPALSGDASDDLNQTIVEALTADGFALVSTTVLGGRKAIRMCPINPRATTDDVTGTIDRLARFAGIEKERLS